MREYQRTMDAAGNVYQWVSIEQCMVLDSVTGEVKRFEKGKSIGTLNGALEYVKQLPGWEERMVIVKLDSIKGYPVNGSESAK